MLLIPNNTQMIGFDWLHAHIHIRPHTIAKCDHIHCTHSTLDDINLLLKYNKAPQILLGPSLHVGLKNAADGCKEQPLKGACGVAVIRHRQSDNVQF